MSSVDLLNWDTVLGHRSLRCGGKVGGVLEEKECWSLELPEGLHLGKVVFQGDTVFAYADDRAVYSIDIDTGEIKWCSGLPDKQVRVSHINSSPQFLVAENFVLRNDTGEICADLRDYTGGLQLQAGTPIEVFENDVYKVINVKQSPGKVLKYSIDKGEAEIVDTGVLNLCMPDGNSILGWMKQDDGLVLAKYSLSDSRIEVVNDIVEAGRMLLSNTRLLLMNENKATLLDVPSGDEIWVTDLSQLVHPIAPKFVMQFRLAMSDNVICIAQGDEIVGVNLLTGETMWQRNMPQFGEICILGDLVYGYYERGILVALDSCNGETVWTHEGPALWNSVKAQQNKVLYTNASGVIVCYEWDRSSPYYSSARPE